MALWRFDARQIARAVAVLSAAVPPGAARAQTTIASIDLQKPFAARSDWRLTAVQGPAGTGVTGDATPGVITLCLRQGASGACDPELHGFANPPSTDNFFSDVHELRRAEIVHGRGARPLLFVQTASEFSGDGDQAVRTQALAYLLAADRFVRVYEHLTGRNNNQEVSFIGSGVLKGDIVSVEPTENFPFVFWVVVNAEGPGGAYRRVLRYRSATHYGDGNPLSVVDSEMAGIEERLGLWRPGAPLPLPAGPCPKPHLIHMELWCR